MKAISMTTHEVNAIDVKTFFERRNTNRNQFAVSTECMWAWSETITIFRICNQLYFIYGYSSDYLHLAKILLFCLMQIHSVHFGPLQGYATSWNRKPRVYDSTASYSNKQYLRDFTVCVSHLSPFGLVAANVDAVYQKKTAETEME